MNRKKVLVIGGTGHIGSYLVPRLTYAGHDVSVVARNPKPRYASGKIGWQNVNWVLADRAAEEKDSTWLNRMKGIDADVVIDLMCFSPAQASAMFDAFNGRVEHFLHCGTIWVYGPSRKIPTAETDPRNPVSEYGRNKVTIEKYYHEKFRKDGFPVSILHPGHISGRRWLPIDPQGSLNGVDVYRRLAVGEKVFLPDLGLATLHHVHGDDVAQAFELAMNNPTQAIGESFNVTAERSMTLLGICEAVAAMFGKKPQLGFVPLAELASQIGKQSYDIIVSHISESVTTDISKARRLLGYSPRYTTPQIYEECIDYMLETGQLKL